MQTFSVEINQANLQESLDQMDKMVKEASYFVLNKGNIYYEKKFYRLVTCVHDTVLDLNRGKIFLIRAVEFEDPYITKE